MSGDIIVMANAKLTYVISLVADASIGKKTTYERSLSKLHHFLATHNSDYVGLLEQDGQEYPDLAIVKMTPTCETMLHEKCVADLRSPDTQPFVGRIAGEIFDIAPAQGIKIHTAEASLNRRIYLSLPI